MMTPNQMVREFERVLGAPVRQKWERDKDGDYSMTLISGASAWISKNDSSANQKPWFGQVTGATGAAVRVSGWTLASAKSAAEALLGIR